MLSVRVITEKGVAHCMSVDEALVINTFGLGERSSRTRLLRSLPLLACCVACLTESPVF